MNEPTSPARTAARDPAGSPLDLDRLAASARTAARVVIDVGAGDGRYAYRLARSEPETVVIAVDPAPGAMRATATRAARSPARGGAQNAFFYVVPLEGVDTRLHGLANLVSVTLPWAGLLEGVLRPDPEMLGSLRRLLKADGILALLVNADPAALARCGLPRVIDLDTLASAYAQSGLAGLRAVDAASRPSGTVWEGRLVRRSRRRLVALEARALPFLKGAARRAESGNETPAPASTQALPSGTPEEPQ